MKTSKTLVSSALAGLLDAIYRELTACDAVLMAL